MIMTYSTFAAEAILLKHRLEVQRQKEREDSLFKEANEVIRLTEQCYFCEQSIVDNVFYRCIFHKKIFCKKCIHRNYKNPPYPRCDKRISTELHKECIFQKVETDDNPEQ